MPMKQLDLSLRRRALFQRLILANLTLKGTHAHLFELARGWYLCSRI